MCSYKIDKRKQQTMENLNKCYKVVQQSCSNGISAKDVAKKLDIHRVTAHSYLNTLELMGKVYSEHGLWYPSKNESQEQAIIPKYLIERFWKEEEEIEKENIYGDPFKAHEKARLLWLKLPSPIKENLQQTFDEVQKGLSLRASQMQYLYYRRVSNQATYLKNTGIPLIVREIAKALNDAFKGE